jgi:hypothetical protein
MDYKSTKPLLRREKICRSRHPFFFLYKVNGGSRSLEGSRKIHARTHTLERVKLAILVSPTPLDS